MKILIPYSKIKNYENGVITFQKYLLQEIIKVIKKEGIGTYSHGLVTLNTRLCKEFEDDGLVVTLTI